MIIIVSTHDFFFCKNYFFDTIAIDTDNSIVNFSDSRFRKKPAKC